MKRTLKLMSVLALGLLGLTACDGESSNTSVDTPSEEASAIFNTLDSTYSSLRTGGIAPGGSFDLLSSIADFPDVTVSYSVDSTKTTYSLRGFDYTLGAQNIFSISEDGTQLLCDGTKTYDEANAYGVFTASLTIGDDTFTHDYLANVIMYDISEITDLSSGSAVAFRGYWMGSCAFSENYGNYNASYVQVGDSAMMLYRLDGDMFDENWKIGETLLQITGTYSPYNGLPECTVTSIKEYTGSDAGSYAKPNVKTLGKEDSFTTSDINRKYYIPNAKVTSVSTDTYGTIELTFVVGDDENGYGEKEYTLYLDNRYNDVKQDALKNLKAGWTFSCNTWLGFNSNNYQFTYIENFQSKEGNPLKTVVQIADNASTLYVGTSVAYTAEVTLPLGEEDDSVTWSTSDAEVATVDETGKVTAVKAGKATITATSNFDNTCAAAVDITVEEAPKVQAITDIKTAYRGEDPEDSLVGFTGAVTFVNSGNYYVSDANGNGLYAFHVENTDLSDLKVGDNVTVYGKATLNKGYGLQVTDCLVVKNAEATVTPTPYIIADFEAWSKLDLTNSGDYIVIKGASIVLPKNDDGTIDDKDGKLSLKLGENTIGTNTKPANFKDIDESATYDVTCVVSAFEGATQVLVVSATANK